MRRRTGAIALVAIGGLLASCSDDVPEPQPGEGSDVNTDVGDGGTVTTAPRNEPGEETDTMVPGPTTDAGEEGEQSDTATSSGSGSDVDLGGGSP